MNDDSEVITLEVDPSEAIRGAAAGNAALDAYGKKAVASIGAASKAIEEHGGLVVRTSDRSRNSVNRLVSALEKQAETYGKSGVERLIAQRDQMIQRLGNEESAVRRVTAAYERMISAEKSLAAGGGGGESGTSGFRLNYAIRGVKDVAEGRGTFALAEATNVLLALRGSALAVGGIAAGLAAAGFAAYELHKHLEELHLTAEKVGGKFSRFTDESKMSNAELQVTNDKLQNTIAKLEHRPQNGIKLAIDEAALSADRLSQKLDKSLRAFVDLSKENRPGGFSRFLFGEQDTKDIGELVGGKTGFGGLIGEVYAATSQGQDPGAILGKYRQKVSTLLENAEHPAKIGTGLFAYTPNPEQFSNRRAQLRALLAEIDNESRGYQLERENAGLQTKAGGLESTSGNLDKALEISKRAQEALDTAFQGNQTPIQKYFGDLAKIGLQRNDELRTIPGQGRAVTVAAMKESIAAQQRMLAELKQRTERTDDEVLGLEGFGRGADGGSSLAEAYSKKRFSDIEASLHAAGVIDKNGSFGVMFGQLSAPIPEGYISPQQQLQESRRRERGFLGLYGLRSDLAGARPQDQAEGVYSARLKFADQEYAAQLKIADAISETQKRDEARVSALNDREEKRFEAQMEREQRLLEIDKQHFDQIKSISGGLYHTLFTNPRQFGGQLLGTLREAALHPVVDRLSSMTAQFLTPLFSSGGGMSDVRLIDGAVPVHIVGAGPATSGGGGSSALMGGGFPSLPGFGGISTAMNLAGMLPLAMNGPDGGFGIAGAPGGTVGFNGPVSVGRTGGFGGIGGLFGGKGLGGLLNGKGLSGLWSGLKGNFWNEDINLAPGVTQAASSMGLGGKFAGVLTSKGAASAYLAAGVPLSIGGLSGRSAGTGAGLIEALAGGALTGAGIGTMVLPGIGTAIGAGIGAAVGTAASIGEMLAGVESKQHEAHRLIQSIYGVNLPERGGVIQQIVGMSQQYGNSVSMTVRTPQARQLIELYAMSTGQRSNLFLETPHSASLVQQGGVLNQGLSYFNGTGYNYQSSLPTLGYSAGTIPTSNPYASGAPIYLQLAIGGQSAADALGGQVVRVANPNYVANQNYAALQSGDRYRPAAAMLAPQTIFA